MFGNPLLDLHDGLLATGPMALIYTVFFEDSDTSLGKGIVIRRAGRGNRMPEHQVSNRPPILRGGEFLALAPLGGESKPAPGIELAQLLN